MRRVGCAVASWLAIVILLAVAELWRILSEREP